MDLTAIQSSNGTPSAPNDVWSTIARGIDAVTAYKIARNMNPQTQASPSGTISGNVWNPFPGTQNAYPQAQGKPSFNVPSGNTLSWLLVAGVVALVALLFLRRG